MTCNNIDLLFKKKSDNILNIYFTAGYPELNSTVDILQALSVSGADVIEIGMPYSDPIADGLTIQHSGTVALRHGMTLALLFEQLEGIRDAVPDTPLVLMGYLNPVLQYGVEAFCQKAADIGIDGLILPDLPLYEYTTLYKGMFEKYGLHNIFLISPQTSEDRIRMIDDNSSGFVYMVSSAGITGSKKGVSKAQIDYFDRIKQMKLRNPRLIGFGISDHLSFTTACQYANGAIIGSAFIDHLTEKGCRKESIADFVERILKNKG